MSGKQNVRQQELKERLHDMLLSVQQTIITEAKKNGINPYDVEINTEHFLANFRLTYGVGYYASKRYFNDFKTIGVFLENEDSFRVNFEGIGKAKQVYGVTFPENKKMEKEK